MMSKTKIVEIYRETQDFERCVRESGLSTFMVQLILAKAGLISIKDKIKYGTNYQKLGGMAEQEFQRLVPGALDFNRCIKKIMNILILNIKI